MKKLILTLTLVAASTAAMYGQGRVFFNNLVSGNAITIGIPAADGQGAVGGYVGEDYSVQLLWASGTYADLSSFLAASPSASAVFSFYGTTGVGGPLIDGAGLFDAGTVQMNGPAGTYTMLVRAWYNGGQYETYQAAFGVANTGHSELFTVAVTASPTGPANTMFDSFTVAVVPEPSVIALAGLGTVAMLVVRRRK
jgi:PEP-CTERM putative exosortase interaction domain